MYVEVLRTKMEKPGPDTKNVPNCGGVYWRAASATRKYFANYLRLALVGRCSTLHLECYLLGVSSRSVPIVLTVIT